MLCNIISSNPQIGSSFLGLVLPWYIAFICFQFTFFVENYSMGQWYEFIVLNVLIVDVLEISAL